MKRMMRSALVCFIAAALLASPVAGLVQTPVEANAVSPDLLSMTSRWAPLADAGIEVSDYLETLVLLGSRSLIGQPVNADREAAITEANLRVEAAFADLARREGLPGQSYLRFGGVVFDSYVCEGEAVRVRFRVKSHPDLFEISFIDLLSDDATGWYTLSVVKPSTPPADDAPLIGRGYEIKELEALPIVPARLDSRYLHIIDQLSAIIDRHVPETIRRDLQDVLAFYREEREGCRIGRAPSGYDSPERYYLEFGTRRSIVLANEFFDRESPLYWHKVEALFHGLYHAYRARLDGPGSVIGDNRRAHEEAIRLQAEIFWGLPHDACMCMSLRDLERHDRNDLGKLIREWKREQEGVARMFASGRGGAGADSSGTVPFEVSFAVFNALDDRLLAEVQEAHEAGIVSLWFDYLDGRFTVTGYPFDARPQIRQISGAFPDMRLMINLLSVDATAETIDSFVAAGMRPGRDVVAVNYECCDNAVDLRCLIQTIQGKGFETWLVLNEEVHASVLHELRDIVGTVIPTVVLMSTRPGSHYQPFNPIVFKKIFAIKNMMRKKILRPVTIRMSGSLSEPSIVAGLYAGISSFNVRAWLLEGGRDITQAYKALLTRAKQVEKKIDALREMLITNMLHRVDQEIIEMAVAYCNGSEIFSREDIERYVSGLGAKKVIIDANRCIDVHFNDVMLRIHRKDVTPIEPLGLVDRVSYRGAYVKIYQGGFSYDKRTGYVLGISGSWHDSAAVLVKDGQLVGALEEERITRTKHDHSQFPVNAICRLLDEEGIAIADVDHIAIGWNYNLYVDTPHARAPATVFFEEMDREFSERTNTPLIDITRRNVPERNRDRYQVDRIQDFLAELALRYEASRMPPVSFVRHHRCHAASAYYPCGFGDESTLVISIDGYGDIETGTVWIGARGEMEEVDRFELPHSLGWTYSAITEHLGFKPTYAEGEVMGLAPYGEPRGEEEQERVERLRDLLRNYIYFDRARRKLVINPDYLYYGEMGDKLRVTTEFERAIDAIMPPLKQSSRDLDPLSPEGRPYANLAFVLQEVTETVVYDIVSFFINSHPKTKNIKRVAFAGGIFLNILANGKLIMREGGEGVVQGGDIYIQPAASDSGVAIGAAMTVAHEIYDDDPRFSMQHAFYGPAYTEEEIKEALDKFGLREGVDYRRVDDDELVEQAASCLAPKDPAEQPEAIAWFQGRSEFGPRALGARSILLNLTDDLASNAANRIKRRQLWRPSAISIIEEDAGKFFIGIERSPFMTVAFEPQEGARRFMASGVHASGKRLSRPQTVDPASNPLYWRLLKEMDERIGIPAVVNTSFNRQEPLVENPEEALNTFYYMDDVAALFMGNFIIRRTDALKPSVVCLADEPGIKKRAAEAFRSGDINAWDDVNAEVLERYPDINRIIVEADCGRYGIKRVIVPMTKDIFEGPYREQLVSYIAAKAYNLALAYGVQQIAIGSTMPKMQSVVHAMVRDALRRECPRLDDFAQCGGRVPVIEGDPRKPLTPSERRADHVRLPPQEDRRGVYIGIDVGGTRIKAVLVVDDEVREQKVVDTPYGSGSDLNSAVRVLVRLLAGGRSISGIGISLPGVVDPSANKARWLVNFEHRWSDCRGGAGDFTGDYAAINALPEQLCSEFDIDAVELLNDATAYGIAELDVAQEEDAVLAALGTGVGTARIEGGAIDRARIDQAGGLIINVAKGAPEDKGCESRGCLPAYAGSEALAAAAMSVGLEDLKPSQISALAESRIQAISRGRQARELYRQLAATMVAWMKTLTRVRGDTAFILAGGSTADAGGRVLKEEVETHLQKDEELRDITVRLSEVDREYGGAMGAARYAMARRGTDRSSHGRIAPVSDERSAFLETQTTSAIHLARTTLPSRRNPINASIELDAVPYAGLTEAMMKDELREQMAILAHTMALHISLGFDVRYELRTKRGDAYRSCAYDALMEAIDGLGRSPSFARGVAAELRGRVGTLHDDALMPVTVRVYEVDSFKAETFRPGFRITDDDCIVTISGRSAAGTVATPNYSAALSLGMALAELRFAAREGDRGEYELLFDRVFTAVQRLYKSCGVIAHESDLSKDLFTIVFSKNRDQRLAYILKYSLPPSISLPYDERREAHELIKFILRSA